MFVGFGQGVQWVDCQCVGVMLCGVVQQVFEGGVVVQVVVVGVVQGINLGGQILVM